MHFETLKKNHDKLIQQKEQEYIEMENVKKWLEIIFYFLYNEILNGFHSDKVKVNMDHALCGKVWC